MLKSSGYEYYSIDSLMSEIKRLAGSQNDLPDDDFTKKILVHAFYPMINGRIRISDVPSIVSQTAIAQMIENAIPKDSYAELMGKAYKNEPDAILAVADCLMFGLKKQHERNPPMAVNYYFQAAELRKPEAIVSVAYLYYLQILESYGYDKSIPYPIPTDCKSSQYRSILEKMWYWLNISAELDWMSPFLIKQATEAKEYNSWVLTSTVKRMLIRRNIEAYREGRERQLLHTNTCDNSECTLKLQDESTLKKCSRCKKAKYCSVNCQTSDWKKRHKKECVAVNVVNASNENINKENENKNSILLNDETEDCAISDTLEPKMANIKLGESNMTVYSSTLKADFLKELTELFATASMYTNIHTKNRTSPKHENKYLS